MVLHNQAILMVSYIQAPISSSLFGTKSETVMNEESWLEPTGPETAQYINLRERRLNIFSAHMTIGIGLHNPDLTAIKLSSQSRASVTFKNRG